MSQSQYESSSNRAASNAAIGLKDYLDGLTAVLRAQPDAWVRCEVLQIKRDGKYVRLEFIEHNARGTQQAKVGGGCPPTTIQAIDAAFAANGLSLEVGCKVLVKLRARLHTSYGFQVEVLDIDPSYTLGDYKARVEAIRRRLREEGIWDGNRNLPRPRDYLRLAVVSPPGAAGLGDFRASADALERHGLARVTYFETQFQTADAPAGIVGVLRSIYRDCRDGRYCAVAIVRGGGAAGDLAWLADFRLARAVCCMPVPVLTGIGHERDSTILDEVACIPCDTPSKAAEHVRSTIITGALDADAAGKAIRAGVAAELASIENGASRAAGSAAANVLAAIRSAEIAVRAELGGLRPEAARLLDRCRRLVEGALGMTASNARSTRDAARDGVTEAMRLVRSDTEAALRLAEATVRDADRTADRAPAAAIDVASAAVTSTTATIASGAATRLRLAEQNVGSAQAYVRAAPGEAVARGAEALTRLAGQTQAATSSSLLTAEVAAATRARETRTAAVAALDIAEATVRASTSAAASHARDALGGYRERLAQTRAEIGSRAAAVPEPAAALVAVAHRAALTGAGRALDSCRATIDAIRATAAALDPVAVVAAGYAILRSRDGRPLTNVDAVTSAAVVKAQLRDGSVNLRAANGSN